MNAVQMCARLVGVQLILVNGVTVAMAQPDRLATATISANASTSSFAQDSVRCRSGSAASDDGRVHFVKSSDSHRFAPRWAAGATSVIRVRIDSATSIAGWSPTYRDEVLAALTAWRAVGSPMAFQAVSDDQPADVRIHWIDKFDTQYDGWTTVTWDQSGWLVAADVTLAVRSPKGQLLTAGERAQVVLHEIGHVLGLSHSSNSASIMLPNVKVTAIAPMDIKHLLALYQPADSSEFALSQAQLAGTVSSCLSMYDLSGK